MRASKTASVLAAVALTATFVWYALALLVRRIDPTIDLWAHPAQVVMSATLVVVAVVAAAVHRYRGLFALTIAAFIWFIGDLIVFVLVLDAAMTTDERYDYLLVGGRVLWVVVAVIALDQGPRGTAMIRLSDGAMFAMVFVFAILTLVSYWWPSEDTPVVFNVNIVADGSAAALFFLAAMGVRPPYKLPYGLLAAASALSLIANSSLLHDLIGIGPIHLPWAVLSTVAAQALRVVAVVLVIGALNDKFPQPVHRDPRPLRALLPLTLLIIGAAVVVQPFDDWGRARRYLLLAIAVTLVVREFVTWRVIRRYEATDKQARRELRRRADNDDLTGLLRRDRILSRLRKSLARARADDQPVAIAYVDLDDFSSINDNFGHDVGDRALIEVAARLGTTRAELVGRIGGDEFLLGGFPASQTSQPERLRQSIVDALNRPLNVGGGVALRVTASVGVAVAQPDQDMTLEELIVAADHASYREKRSFTHSRHESARSLLSVTPLDEVRRPLEAMAFDQIAVWYQPVIDLATDSVAGAEALARIVDSDGTITTAGRFVSILQAAGYGDELTNLVLERATTDFARPDVTERGWFVNVNVSDADLAGTGLIERVRGAVRASKLDPQRLTLEIDERIDPSGPLIDVVEQLRQLGVALALDDFGAGSSAFGQIVQVSPALLKLDIGLLPTVGSDMGMQSAALVEAFIRLAHHLGIQVIAEGVETPEQRDLLRSLGCEYGQGFLWAPARSLEHLLQWEDDRRADRSQAVIG